MMQHSIGSSADGRDARNLIPEVSLLTSWSVNSRHAPGLCATDAPPQRLAGVSHSLQEGISLLDLYFLNHLDAAWYAQVGEVSLYTEEPHAFAASLSLGQIDKIAASLRQALSEWYDGKLVGRRPRFVSFATFFPDISFVAESGSESDNRVQIDRRIQAVQALRNTLYLAGSLGVRCVEIVGGAGVPIPTHSHSQVSPEDYRSNRWKAMMTSLEEIYDLDLDLPTPAGSVPNPLKDLQARGRVLPFIAMELEPGTAFLMNELRQFKKLREEITSPERRQGRPGSCIADYLCLNVDVAHAFIIGYTVENIIQSGLKEWVAHVHLSDHGGDYKKGGGHASDLSPNVFHYYDEYLPWLTFAMELIRERSRRYSHAIGIEMEACRDVTDAISAIQVTRQWLREIARDKASGTVASGLLSNSSPARTLDTVSEDSQDEMTVALLVIDIGNSTSELLQGAQLKGHPGKLEAVVRTLCRIVHRNGGSVMSFTGDGFIAIFEDSQFRDAAETTFYALRAALDICHEMAPSSVSKNKVTVRAALHWGVAYIPTAGQLRDQLIGIDVVRTARLCGWLASVIEPAQPIKERNDLIAATKEFMAATLGLRHLPKKDAIETHHGTSWGKWGPVDCKGLMKPTEVYRMRPRR